MEKLEQQIKELQQTIEILQQEVDFMKNQSQRDYTQDVTFVERVSFRGKVKFTNLATSSSEVQNGMIWNDSGTLKIK